MNPIIDGPPTTNGDLVNRVNKLRLGERLDSKPSRGGATWLPWALCILLALAWAGVGIRGYKNAPAPTTAPASTSTEAAAAPANPSAPAPGSVALTLKGYLIPARQIAVSPIDVAGRVVELNIIEGKKYKQGDVLAKIEDTSYVAMVDESKASLAAAEKRLIANKAKLAALQPESVRIIEVNQVEQEMKEAEAQKGFAQDELARLTKIGVAATAEREVNQARFDLQAATAKVSKLAAVLAILKEGPRREMKEAAEADVHSAEDDVNAAKARLVQSRWRLDNCVIRSPIGGTILEKRTELYNLVNPLALAGISGSICDMADLSDMEVDIEVGEREIAKLVNVKNCRIVADAYPGRTYTGTLDRIMPVAIRSNNVVKVRVKLRLPAGEEPGTYLKPNMGAVVTFLADK
jgi:multidrug resistance efflux pump